MHQIKTESMEDTMRLGEKLALLLKKGDVITLEGELGAGKTTFTKGIAKGLGVVQSLSSPTFTIIKEYKGTLPLYHMDAYRLEHSEEDLGFDEYFHGNGVSVVEWAQFILEFLPNERLDVRIEYLNEHQRLFTLSPRGKHFENVAEELKS